MTHYTDSTPLSPSPSRMRGPHSPVPPSAPASPTPQRKLRPLPIYLGQPKKPILPVTPPLQDSLVTRVGVFPDAPPLPPRHTRPTIGASATVRSPSAIRPSTPPRDSRSRLRGPVTPGAMWGAENIVRRTEHATNIATFSAPGRESTYHGAAPNIQTNIQVSINTEPVGATYTPTASPVEGRQAQLQRPQLSLDTRRSLAPIAQPAQAQDLPDYSTPFLSAPYTQVPNIPDSVPSSPELESPTPANHSPSRSHRPQSPPNCVLSYEDIRRALQDARGISRAPSRAYSAQGRSLETHRLPFEPSRSSSPAPCGQQKSGSPAKGKAKSVAPIHFLSRGEIPDSSTSMQRTSVLPNNGHTTPAFLAPVHESDEYIPTLEATADELGAMLEADLSFEDPEKMSEIEEVPKQIRRPKVWYVVFKGLRTGVYHSWNRVSEYTKGVSGNLQNKYDSRHAAITVYNKAKSDGIVERLYL
ncbi:hypothetical protein CERSUDRAFT_92751 [Gelatoporia subvermispora B]|uniref:Ribonuclease H1 N-terminal domain-containing protein n=1 Tax=Ceriporiopsis subvermispora (strain B) TaxID=914234 RepID=M2RN10_CERS8|nr:hypothetical protein CERSUDRAFT_92751 [Gelatoporia subvermispora B]